MTLPSLRRSISLAFALLTTLVVVPPPASANIITGPTATQLAAAIASAGVTVGSASYVSVPASGTPNAVADAGTALVGFPRDGDTYAILTSGNASLADDPNDSSSSGVDLGGGTIRGGALDATILKVDVSVPPGANCLSAEFRFLSEEYPEFVGSNFNDAFVAELDNSTWSIGAGGVVTAPNNFAFDQNNQPITINTSGLTAITAAEAAGTTYDGATPLLQANTPISSGAHSVYFSIFDQGDHAYDSAVFLDALSIGAVAPGQCIAGATLTVKNLQLTSTETSTPPGVDDADLATLPANKLSQRTPETDSAPIGRAPIGRAPIGRAPIGRAPIGRAPIGRAPIGRAPIGRAPIGRAPIGRATLASFPLNVPGGWSTILAATSDYKAAQPQGVTMFQLFADPFATDGNEGTLSQLDARCGGAPGDTSPPSGCNAFAIALADMNVAGSPLENVSLLSFLLGDLTWNDVTPPVGGWCPEWTAVSTIACDTTRTIFDSEAEGVPLDLTSLPVHLVADLVGDPTRTRAVFWSLTLTDLNVTGTFLASVNLADIEAGGNLDALCSGAVCSSTTATLADAKQAGALTNTGTLGDVGAALSPATLSDIVLMVLDPTALEWESLPLADAGFENMTQGEPTNFIHYSMRFDLGCANAAGLHTSVVLPPEFRYRPGSSTISFNNGAASAVGNPSVSGGGTLDWNLSTNAASCTGSSSAVRLDFQAMPGFTLGTFGATASVQTSSIVVPITVTAQAPVSVFDPESIEGPNVATVNHLIVGYLDAPGERDVFEVDVEPGHTLSVTLSHLGHDYDLVVYAPPGADDEALLRDPGSVVPISGGSFVTDPPDALAGVLAPPALEGIHLEAGRVVAGISSLRGTEQEGVTTTAVAGNPGSDYTIQVSGHNGAFGDEPYVLIARDSSPYSIPTCVTLPSPTNTSTMAFPSATGTGDHTLYVFDEGALKDSYGATDTGSIISALQTVAETPEGNGLLVPIDANTSANAALDAYRSDLCSVPTGNAAVRAVNDAIDTIGGLGGIENVVLVGDDAILPHAALADGTVDGNESGFAGDVVFSDPAGAARSNHLTAAFASNAFLSDAPYATPHPVKALGQVVYVPQWAFGRLTGSAQDIVGALTRFDDADGAADPSTAVTAPRRALEADYDFLSDGGKQIFDRLAAQVGPTNAVRLFGNWSRGDVLAQFLQASNKPHVVSINAHYDQYRLLPGLGNATGNVSSLVTTADVDAATGLAYRILFSIGCHFGLDIANAYAPLAGDAARARDWAEAYAHAGVAAMVGNLGYGYGDTATVAFSEKLMADFAANLDGSMSIGQGLNAAEQDYFSSASALSPYDFKVLQQTVLWGLPMYSPSGPLAGAPATPASPVPPPTADPQTGGLSTTNVAISPTFTQRTSGDGHTFYEADGLSDAIHPYPIMPKTVTVLPTAGPLVAHGAVPLSLTRTEQPIDIAFANATVDRSSLEPATPYETVYPLASRIGTSVTAAGTLEQDLVVIPAEFGSDDDLSNPASLGTFGKYTASTWLVTYGPATGDFTPPEISEVTVGTGGAISARVRDGSGSIVRVFAQVLKGDGTFDRVELSSSGGGVFTATTTATGIRAVSIYAVDGNGNTAAAHDKELGFVAEATGDARKPAITVFTPPSAPAIYNLNQTVAEQYTCVDEVDPAPTCTDLNAGTNLNTSTPGAHVFTVTSTDDSGNTATVSRTYYVRFAGFLGFFAPVDNLPTINTAKAGSTVPLRWRILDANGVPVSSPSHFVSVTSTTFGSCSGLSDVIETYSGSSGLQYLGNGNWQFNWKTQKAWAGSCREVTVNLNDGTPSGRGYISARFTFK